MRSIGDNIVPMFHRVVPALALTLLGTSSASAADGLRVAAWNISSYSGGRTSHIQTSVYGEFEGRSFAPDAILLQEMTSEAAVAHIVLALNTAPGSPGDWAMAPFIDGNDTDNAFVYRTSKLHLLDSVVVAEGGPPPNHPRDVNRYDVQPVGYESDATIVSLYSSHMKAGTSSQDQQRRLLEAQAIRADAESLPVGRNFILGGDFNIQSSNQAAYQELVGSQANNAGRFFDPIATPGSWNNNPNFRFVHTQDPVGPGGMDDRHDQLLLSATLIDGNGLDYIGDPATPYSSLTWNDSNHSYRAWGNDGSSFDTVLRSEDNEMVGPAIADALKAVANGAGHLPVFLDLRVPARIVADALLDFGTVTQGTEASLILTIGNAGDADLWGEHGVEYAVYTLAVAPPYVAPFGPHTDAPGGTFNQHSVTLDTSTVGFFETTLVIASNDPDMPEFHVALIADVVEACPADWNNDGTVNTLDVLQFLNAWTAGDPAADLNGDTVINTLDVLAFLNIFAAGCD